MGRGTSSKFGSGERGATAVQVLVILVPVIFGVMGFAVDLGRLYLVRAELKTAANAMALAAAEQLIGTETALDSASSAARLALDDGSGAGNRYNFGMLQIGATTGFLASQVSDPVFYTTASAAAGSDGSEESDEATGATARYVRVSLTAEAPLFFWSFLPLASERKTSITAHAVAGVSAPLCTACGIEPLAIAALSQEDTTNFGFEPNVQYTFAYSCNGQQPSPITGTTRVIPYLILDHYNQEAETLADENTQLYRIGAQGLLPSTNSALSCLSVNAEKQVWTSANRGTCGAVVPQVRSLVCGLTTRFSTETSGACASIPEVESIAGAYIPDTDLNLVEEYASYTGNGRRIVTVPVVDSLANTSAMVVLGFRQFLVEPNPNDVSINAADSNARFAVLYLGSVAPVRQGRFDGCQIAAGPGKVVLHQ